MSRASVFGEGPYQERHPFGHLGHRGADFANGGQVALPSLVEGVVAYVGWSSVMGNMVSVYCARLKKYVGYSHMAGRALKGVGTRVYKDTILGYEGRTGSAATGNHCHVTVATGANPAIAPVVNPMLLIRSERVAVAPKPSAPASNTANWGWNAPAASVQLRIQRALKARGRYTGLVNGIFGPLTIKGIQTTAKSGGYTGPVNGIPGRNTAIAIQRYAAKFGGYTGPINGFLGANSWEGFARGLAKGL